MPLGKKATFSFQLFLHHIYQVSLDTMQQTALKICIHWSTLKNQNINITFNISMGITQKPAEGESTQHRTATGGGISIKYVSAAVATYHTSSFLGLQLPEFENLVQLHV